VKSEPGPPMTLGGAAAAQVRFICCDRRPFDPNGSAAYHRQRRTAPSHAQGATLFVLLQPLPFSTRLKMPGLGAEPLSTAVLSVTLDGQPTSSPV
jgi:hypothetical protein